jgi:hypothetical protein
MGSILKTAGVSHMKIKQQIAGVHSGVQKRILDLNPLAVFVPCNNHSFSLVGVHAAAVNVQELTFFGTVELLFGYFHVQLTGGMF